MQEKEKLLKLSTISIKFEIVVCKLFQFGRVYEICCLGKGELSFYQFKKNIVMN